MLVDRNGAFHQKLCKNILLTSPPAKINIVGEVDLVKNFEFLCLV
jgi:hypothetical protein